MQPPILFLITPNVYFYKWGPFIGGYTRSIYNCLDLKKIMLLLDNKLAAELTVKRILFSRMKIMKTCDRQILFASTKVHESKLSETWHLTRVVFFVYSATNRNNYIYLKARSKGTMHIWIRETETPQKGKKQDICGALHNPSYEKNFMSPSKIAERG